MKEIVRADLFGGMVYRQLLIDSLIGNISKIST